MNLNYKKTGRGFAIIEFNDYYGHGCSLQKSSLATDDAVWLGVNDASPQILASDAAALGVATVKKTGWVPFPVSPQVMFTTRMHLTRDQVRELLPVLQAFVETGEVIAP